MATKKSTKTIDLVDLSAYIAIVFAAVIFLITAIMNALKGNNGIIANVIGYMTLIKDIAVIIALGLGGYNFARTRGMVVKVFFYIAIIVYIVAMLCGVFIK